MPQPRMVVFLAARRWSDHEIGAVVERARLSIEVVVLTLTYEALCRREWLRNLVFGGEPRTLGYPTD